MDLVEARERTIQREHPPLKRRAPIDPNARSIPTLSDYRYLLRNDPVKFHRFKYLYDMEKRIKLAKKVMLDESTAVQYGENKVVVHGKGLHEKESMDGLSRVDAEHGIGMAAAARVVVHGMTNVSHPSLSLPKPSLPDPSLALFGGSGLKRKLPDQDQQPITEQDLLLDQEGGGIHASLDDLLHDENAKYMDDEDDVSLATDDEE